MKTVLNAAAAVLLLAAAATADAHELFITLKPAPSGSREQVVVVNNGTFHQSAAVVRKDRIRDLTLHQGGVASKPELTTWTEEGDQSRLTIKPGATGTFMVGLSSKRSSSTRTAKEFAEYLAIEDLPDTLATFDASKYPKGVTYGYMKHARAIGQAGSDLTGDFAATLGYPLEIRLDRNPGSVHVGERITLQLLHEGVPVPGLRVYVGAAAHAPAAGGHDGATLMRTDAKGQASFEVTTPGTWYIHANRMVPSTEAGFDFLSDRASLTFDIGRPERSN